LGIGLGRAGIVDDGAGRHRLIVEPVIERDRAQVVVQADEVALGDRNGLEEVEMKMRERRPLKYTLVVFWISRLRDRMERFRAARRGKGNAK